jgi:hypothetical protein
VIQGKPALSRVSLSGVRSAPPHLSFTLAAGRGAPLIKTVSIASPRGLHFTRSHPTVSVSGSRGKHLRFTVSLRHGALVIKLKKPARQVHVALAYPRLRTSAGKLSKRVTISAWVTDANSLATKLSKKVRPRS